MKKHSVKTGLFVGRFQPFHLGHLSAIKQALAQVDFLVIGIGSSQYSRTEENPFTLEERKQMIEETLKEEGITAFEIKAIPDIHDDTCWVSHMRLIVPKFDTVVTANPETRRFFEEDGKTPIFEPKKEINISATEIRQKMKKKEDLNQCLPSTTIKTLQKSGFIH